MRRVSSLCRCPRRASQYFQSAPMWPIEKGRPIGRPFFCRSLFRWVFCAGFCGRDCRALALQGPSRPRRACAGSARRVARRMRASLSSGHGWPVDKPRSTIAKSLGHGCPNDRGREGALLFGYFLLGKQEKVTRAQGCAWKTQGCGSVIARTQRRHQTHPHPTLPLKGRAKDQSRFRGITGAGGNAANPTPGVSP